MWCRWMMAKTEKAFGSLESALESKGMSLLFRVWALTKTFSKPSRAAQGCCFYHSKIATSFPSWRLLKILWPRSKNGTDTKCCDNTCTHKARIFLPPSIQGTSGRVSLHVKIQLSDHGRLPWFSKQFSLLRSVVACSVCKIRPLANQPPGPIRQSLLRCFDSFLECCCF